jgi:CRP/FNR family transcriptional regulator, cyclic AMP receptor protein
MQAAELLNRVPLFKGLSESAREELVAQLVERPFKAGELVFARGDPGSTMYCVLSGTLEIFLPPANGIPRVDLKEARPGEHFGELALFDDKPRSASVAARTDSVLLELSRDHFLTIILRSEGAVLAILSELAVRMRDTTALLGQRAAKDVVKEFEASLSWRDKLADRVAELNGSWAFILGLLGLTIAWATLNAFAPRPWDAYPFQFFNLLLGILVGLQGPLIMMSQNRQAAKDRAQAKTDYRVNLKNEVGIEELAHELADLRQEMLDRLDAQKQPSARSARAS